MKTLDVFYKYNYSNYKDIFKIYIILVNVYDKVKDIIRCKYSVSLSVNIIFLFVSSTKFDKSFIDII